ncbi:hypothetical protein FDECE_13916 [Fusarium decemcellulare]|nr:hypothetical protein FDECE_13916 [Fusarium decemcellulare]
MKRKIWLYITEWDLEIAILLSQPKVIDQTCCSVRLPDARQNLTLRRVMARVGLFKFIFEYRDHNRPRLEDGIRTWQEGLPPDLEYSPEALRSDVPEGKFYRIYAHVVKIIAHISPLIPRPGISNMDPVETSAVIGHCLCLAESLQNLVEMLRAQEIRMLFFSYYIFTCIAVLCRAHNSATDTHLTEVANEKVRWAYDYLLDAEASSNLATALTPVLPKSFKSSLGRSSSVEEARVERSTGTVESSSSSRSTSMASTAPGVSSENFFDTLRSEQLDALANKWRQEALESGEDL